MLAFLRRTIAAFVAVLWFAGSGMAGTTTIDFADTSGVSNPFTSRGYDFNVLSGTIIQHGPILFELWNLNNTHNFTIEETNNQPFDLQQLYILLTTSAGPSQAHATFDFTGYLQGGGTVTRQVQLDSYIYPNNVTEFGEETVVFDSSWVNLTSVDVAVAVTNNSLSSTVFDDIIVRSGPILPAVIDVDTAAPNRPVHPHHDGSPGAVNGLNDVIEVVVLGSSTSVGDPVDLNTDDIDPATLRFGPSEASIDPGSAPEFNVNYDGDGIDDARFHFLTGDAGIGCADTEVTLTGETTTGDEFAGTDSAFASNCNANCHN